MAQSVKCPTLDFGSGHYLRVVRSSATLGSVVDMDLKKREKKRKEKKRKVMRKRKEKEKRLMTAFKSLIPVLRSH